MPPAGPPHLPLENINVQKDLTMTENDKPLSEDTSVEGPEAETPTNDSDGTTKPVGLGGDGTIPNHPGGIAAGHTGTASTFEPEEDEHAE